MNFESIVDCIKRGKYRWNICNDCIKLQVMLWRIYYDVGEVYTYNNVEEIRYGFESRYFEYENYLFEYDFECKEKVIKYLLGQCDYVEIGRKDGLVVYEF